MKEKEERLPIGRVFLLLTRYIYIERRRVPVCRIFAPKTIVTIRLLIQEVIRQLRFFHRSTHRDNRAQSVEWWTWNHVGREEVLHSSKRSQSIKLEGLHYCLLFSIKVWIKNYRGNFCVKDSNEQRECHHDVMNNLPTNKGVNVFEQRIDSLNQ